MSKDYAQKYSTPNKRSRRNKRIIVLLSLAIILLIGGFFSSAIYFERHAKTRVTSSKQSVQPTFDFYSILTDAKTQVPQDEINITVAPKAVGPGYLLQVAAVRGYTDAMQLKAQLILWGFTAFIQKFQQNGITWNRINVGPYTSLAAAKADQLRLKQHQINSMLFTLKSKT